MSHTIIGGYPQVTVLHEVLSGYWSRTPVGPITGVLVEGHHYPFARTYFDARTNKHVRIVRMHRVCDAAESEFSVWFEVADVDGVTERIPAFDIGRLLPTERDPWP